MRQYLVAGKNGRQPWSSRAVWLFVAAPSMAVLTAASTPWAVDHIEDRLEREAADNLSAAGIDPSGFDIDFDYRDGQATGVLPTGIDAATIEQSADEGIITSFEFVGTDGQPSPTVASTTTATPTTVTTTAPTTPTTAASLPIPVSVRAESGDGRLVLSGDVATEDQRDQLLAAAAAAYGAENVVDGLRVTNAPPVIDGADDRVADLAGLIGGLSHLQSGVASLEGDALSVSGEGEADGVAAIEAAVDGIETSTSASIVTTDAAADEEARLLAEETEALQAELVALQEEIRETVTFATGSALLRRPAGPTLDKIADAMDRYRRPVVEIGGHTDDVGNADDNRRLSQERAEAVMAGLVARGVPVERLQAVGYGPDQPLADNTTVEGRQENRRVEANALASF